MQEHQEAMVKSLVAVAWADGRMDNEESEIVEALVSAFGLNKEDGASMRAYAKTPRTLDDLPLSSLSASDRRLLLQHAVILTYIDGSQSETEVKVIRQLVAKMKIPDDEAATLLLAAEARAKSLLDRL